MKVYSITIPLKIIVKSFHYNYDGKAVETSKEEVIELDLQIYNRNSEQDAIEEAKNALERLIRGEMGDGCKEMKRSY